MGAQPALRFRHSGQAARGLWSACLIVVLLASCAAPLPVATTPASAAPVWAPAASTAPAWSSINWTADDEALFGGPGNQYIFGGTSWAGGTVLVGEDDGLDPGMGDAVVWVSADNAHWRRIPNSGGTFSDASMRAVASSGSTLVAVGFFGPVGLAWTSSDGSHWQRVADEGGALGDLVPFGIAGGSHGFVIYGVGPDATLGLAFSPDGLHWQRVAPVGTFAKSSIGGVTATDAGFAAVGSNDANPAQGQGGSAGAWWSSDGLNWHQSDVGTGAYAIRSVEPWIGSLRALGIPPCTSCIGPEQEWRSTDDGHTWRRLAPPTTTSAGSTELLVGDRAVSLQNQPQEATWSADEQTWHVLAMTNSPLSDGAGPLLASDQSIIAVGSIATVKTSPVDMRVYIGTIR